MLASKVLARRLEGGRPDGREEWFVWSVYPRRTWKISPREGPFRFRPLYRSESGLFSYFICVGPGRAQDTLPLLLVY